MPISLSVNGIGYAYPSPGDTNWGSGATTWASAVTSGMLSKAGGNFSLTADTNFGGTFGIFVKYLTSVSASPAGSGVVRLANLDGIAWRNSLNTADLLLQPDADGILQYGGVDLVNVSSAQTLTNKTISGNITGHASLDLEASNNLSDLASVVTARANLGLGSAALLASTAVLQSANNLSDLASVITARTNLGLGSAALLASTAVLQATNNLSDLGNVATARTNLGLGTAALLAATAVLQVANNLSDVANLTTARANLSAAKSGANSDITALTGLTTPLSIPQGGTGQITQAAAFNALSPITTTGDLILGNGANSAARLPVGSNNTVLTSNGTTASWEPPQGSGGSKNYLGDTITSNGSNSGNGNFDTGVTTNWSLANSVLSGTTPTSVAAAGNEFSSISGGRSASANLSFSAVNFKPIQGLYSGSLVSSAASLAGDMLVSAPFYIDNEDQAKVLSIKFGYWAESGASALNFSGTSSNSYAVWVYDVTNAAWIQPAGVYNLVQSSGIGVCTATFQTTSNSTQYQLALVNVNASTAAYTLYVDDFSVGPATSVMGPAMSDWVAYTPSFTGLGTVSAIHAFSKREGDSLLVQAIFTTGTVTATIVTMGLGYNGASGNVTTDMTKVQDQSAVGGAGGSGANANVYGVLANGTTPTTAYITFNAVSGLLTPVTGSAAFSSNAAVSVSFRVPIVGWSSNTVMSADTDTRVIGASYGLTALQTLAANTTIKYDTLIKDTAGAYSTATGLYTAPVSGMYRISAQVDTSVAGNAYIKVNGVGKSYLVSIIAANSAYSGSISYPLNSGDTVGIYFDTASNANGSATQGYVNYLSIERLSGPAVVQATESVNAGYNTAAGQAIGTSNTLITFGTKEYDSHNAFNGTVYTAPVTGKYSITGLIAVNAALPATAYLILTAYKNGAYVKRLGLTAGNGSSSFYGCGGSASLALNAGDTLSLYGYCQSGTVNLYADGGDNFFSIARVGN